MHRAVSAPSITKWVWCDIAVGSVLALFFNSFEFTFTELPPFVSYDDDHWGNDFLWCRSVAACSACAAFHVGCAEI